MGKLRSAGGSPGRRRRRSQTDRQNGTVDELGTRRSGTPVLDGDGLTTNGDPVDDHRASASTGAPAASGGAPGRLRRVIRGGDFPEPVVADGVAPHWAGGRRVALGGGQQP
ncbi:MAG: hypothetical protein ACRDTE_11645 [Pseudonocardiaceae bacterium]